MKMIKNVEINVIFVKTGVYMPVYRSQKGVVMLTAHFWCTRGKKRACGV